MRSIVLCVCVLAAGCSGQALNSPTSPTSAISGAAHTSAQSATQLSFTGSFTTETHAVFAPPITLVITGTAAGTATHLGSFNATSLDNVDTTNAKSTGTFEFVAANGDHLFARTAGGEDAFTPPNISHVTLVATIEGGTGRVAAATGTFTIQLRQEIDLATGTAAGSGSFEGHISLNR